MFEDLEEPRHNVPVSCRDCLSESVSDADNIAIEYDVLETHFSALVIPKNFHCVLLSSGPVTRHAPDQHRSLLILGQLADNFGDQRLLERLVRGRPVQPVLISFVRAIDLICIF